MTWRSTPRGLYGESGIRTHGTLTSTHAFQACTLGHSVISPSATDGRSTAAYTDVRADVRRHGWPKHVRVHGCTSGPDRTRACERPVSKSKPKLPERVGFEPTEPQAAQRFSRPPDSTALASLPAPRMARGRRELGRTADDQAHRAEARRSHGWQSAVQAPKWRTGGAAMQGKGAVQKYKIASRIQEATRVFVPKRIRTSDL